MGVDPHDICCGVHHALHRQKGGAGHPQSSTSACGDPDVDVVLTTREFVRMLRGRPDRSRRPGGGALRQSPGHRHRRGGDLRRHRRRDGRGPAQRLLPGDRSQPRPGRLHGRPGHGPALEGGRASTFPAQACPGGGGQRPGQYPQADGRHAPRARSSYDFVEVMACPGGCAGGGGQPIRDGVELAWDPGATILWNLDKPTPISASPTRIRRCGRCTTPTSTSR